VIPFEREPRRDRGREPKRDFARRTALPDASGELTKPSPAPAARTGVDRAGWMIGPLLLCCVACAMLFIVRGPDQIFGVAFGIVLCVGLVWILVSALLPARADRNCPQCGRKTVQRIDARTLHGLRCRACSWRDESASAFIHAEDDGRPLEDIVLRERGRFRR
jgi:ribosomal protein L37AE/L43A